MAVPIPLRGFRGGAAARLGEEDEGRDGTALCTKARPDKDMPKNSGYLTDKGRRDGRTWYTSTVPF